MRRRPGKQGNYPESAVRQSFIHTPMEARLSFRKKRDPIATFPRVGDQTARDSGVAHLILLVSFPTVGMSRPNDQ